MAIRCTNDSGKVSANNIDFVTSLQGYGDIIASKDTNSIKEICTSNGYSSIMDWTDSLQNTRVIDLVVLNLNDTLIQYSIMNDSTLKLDLLEWEHSMRKNRGALDFVISNNQLFIDQFWGGESL